jgi:hypothetical protein
MPTNVSTAQITIVDTNDGLAASLIPRPSLIVACDSAGVPLTYTGLEGTLQIMLGGVDDTANWTVYVSSIGSGIAYRDSDDGADRTGTGAVSGLITGTPGYVKVTSFTAADSAYIELTATKIGQTPIVRRLDLVKSKAAVPGTPGTRGTVAVYIGGYTAWSDTVADAYFTTNYSGTKVMGDTVTLYGPEFAQTRQWTGSAWSTLTATIDGNLVAQKTISAVQLANAAVTPDKLKSRKHAIY